MIYTTDIRLILTRITTRRNVSRVVLDGLRWLGHNWHWTVDKCGTNPTTHLDYSETEQFHVVFEIYMHNQKLHQIKQKAMR